LGGKLSARLNLFQKPAALGKLAGLETGRFLRPVSIYQKEMVSILEGIVFSAIAFPLLRS
jgi:hypothetical protein